MAPNATELLALSGFTTSVLRVRGRTVLCDKVGTFQCRVAIRVHDRRRSDFSGAGQYCSAVYLVEEIYREALCYRYTGTGCAAYAP